MLTGGLLLQQPADVVHEIPPTIDQDITVILGAGVIGLSTAYYLALSLKENGTCSLPSRPKVIVVEPSHGICPGASGGATGGLGDFGFSEAVSPLGEFSYGLHKELASAYQGRKNWSFRDQNVFRVTPKNFKGDLLPPDSWAPVPPLETNLSSLPDWIKTSDHWSVQLLAPVPHSSHIDPARFCQFLYKQCQDLGVQFRFNSTVTSVQQADDRESFRSVTVESSTPSQTTKVIPCNALVIAGGPWSANLFSSLFPEAVVKLRMNTTWSAGNYVRVRNPRPEKPDEQSNSTQVFLNNVLPDSNAMDITSFLDGSLYLGGWGAIPEVLPEYADNVEPQQAEIDSLLKMARQHLSLEPDEMLEVFDIGRCYRPQAVPNRPIVTRVKWSLLGYLEDSPRMAHSCPRGPVEPKPAVVGGLYINTGHDSDGVTLGPGSGKVMSELLLGRMPSVSVSELDLES
ncbi:FAD dependent oxidoreductase [Penicillium italicum]|uniref:FAD dependent oxidoreductase n=1 Tax=Penicillium italicum TaxID=40296 RepID=A0A0A2KYB3_PENIT|nr:FAD dependent oxidoreductase [Penicillium italicum]